MDRSSAKILVLGDSGVGKSSLVHLICHSTIAKSTQWTIGCSIDVKIFRNNILEFWDIGGSRSHKIARSFLYQDYQGIILVFDSTNNKSRLNLIEWMREANPDAYVKVITIGTRKDLMTEISEPPLDSPVLYVNTQDVLSFSPDSFNYSQLIEFFKAVVERRNKFII